MKSKFVISMIATCMFGCLLPACSGGGGGDDPEPTPAPSGPTLSVSPADFRFSSSKGDAQNMTINTDADATWTIYNNDLSSKISVSSSNGTGSTNITLRTKEDNDEQVEGKLQIVATKGGVSTTKNVSIIVEGSLPTDCEVNVKKIGNTDNDDMLIMSYGFACVMEWKPNTRYFLYKIYTDAEYNSMRGNYDKIIAEATKVGTTWKQIEIPSSGGIEIVYDECMPNTAYEFVWIPYTQNGKTGKIDSKHFVTKHNTDDQPLASVKPAGSVSQNDVQGGNSGSYYKWSVEQNRSSDSYYTYVCAGATETETMKKRNDNEYGTNKPEDGISVAWEIMNTVRNGWNTSGVVEFNKGNKSCREMLFTKSIKDGDFSFAHDPSDKFLQIVTWALDRNGDYSGMVYDVVYKVENGILIPQLNSDPYLTVDKSSLSFDYSGSSSTFSISSNVSWTVTSSATWCTVSPASGSNNGTVTVKVSENTTTADRSATITVTGGGITRTITVTQGHKDPDPYLTVNKSSLSFGYSSGSNSFTVSSNVSWTVTSSATWCTVSPASGSNNGTVTVKVSENTTTADRPATITVTGGGITRTISVTQGHNSGAIPGEDDNPLPQYSKKR